LRGGEVPSLGCGLKRRSDTKKPANELGKLLFRSATQPFLAVRQAGGG
jgi:hypothetical protein